MLHGIDVVSTTATAMTCLVDSAGGGSDDEVLEAGVELSVWTIPERDPFRPLREGKFHIERIVRDGTALNGDVRMQLDRRSR